MQANSTGMIDPRLVVVPPYHRKPKPWLLEQLTANIAANGYNVAYPIVIDGATLVEGQHRLLAAIANKLESIPYVAKPQHISPIRFGLQCNADGQLTAADDVFDLAELCWQLAEVEGWEGKRIATELGWKTTEQVYQHGNIKKSLHERAWLLARNGELTKTEDVVSEESKPVVSRELTKVGWRETHFRAFLAALPCPVWKEGEPRPADYRAAMRAQLAVIREAQARAGQGDKRFGQTEKQVTAKWLGAVAERHAWQKKLARYAANNLVQRVKLRPRLDLLRSVRQNVYGDKEDPATWEKFTRAIARMNEEALGITLIQGDSLQVIPTLENGAVNLVVTDPPYNVTDHEWDKIGTDVEYLDFTRAWLDALRPKLATDYHLFIFCDPKYQADIEQLLRADGWPLLSRIIWSNRSLPSGRMASNGFVSTWQMLFHCGTHALNWSPEWSDERFDVQVFAAPNSNMKDGGWHPTPKPEALIERLVRFGSKPTDLVLDCFAGGGTTGAACATVRQRRCVLIERNEEYCQRIEKRLSIRRDAQ